MSVCIPYHQPSTNPPPSRFTTRPSSFTPHHHLLLHSAMHVRPTWLRAIHVWRVVVVQPMLQLVVEVKDQIHIQESSVVLVAAVVALGS